MITIWKYTLEPGVTEVALIAGAEVLTAQAQGETVQLWARVNLDIAFTERRAFQVVPTGGDAPDIWKGRYISTVQLSGGRLIFHVFEVKP